MTLLRPGDPREMVRLDVVYHDETWDLTDPVPRQVAVETLALFARTAWCSTCRCARSTRTAPSS